MRKLFFEDKRYKIQNGYSEIAMDEVLNSIQKYKLNISNFDKRIINIENSIITNLSEYQITTKNENAGIIPHNDARVIKNRVLLRNVCCGNQATFR